MDYKQLLKDMFSDMVEKKDLSKIPIYYHEDFHLYTNGHEYTYQTFVSSHEEIYKTPIKYSFRYDEENFVQESDRLAARVWITTQLQEGSSQELEVFLIAQFKEGKIYRVWEVTYPDWSAQPEFDLPGF